MSRMRNLEEAIQMTGIAMEALQLIEEQIAEIDSDEQTDAANRMAIISLMLGIVCIRVGHIANRHPREVVSKIAEEVINGLPPMPEPKVEAMAEGKSRKRGASPWSEPR